MMSGIPVCDVLFFSGGSHLRVFPRILDEADNMTSSAQFALRRMIEQYASNCRFILICNYSSSPAWKTAIVFDQKISPKQFFL